MPVHFHQEGRAAYGAVPPAVLRLPVAVKRLFLCVIAAVFWEIFAPLAAVKTISCHVHTSLNFASLHLSAFLRVFYSVAWRVRHHQAGCRIVPLPFRVYVLWW